MKGPPHHRDFTKNFLCSIIIATMFTQYHPFRLALSFQPIAVATRRRTITILSSSSFNILLRRQKQHQPQQQEQGFYSTSNTLLKDTIDNTIRCSDEKNQITSIDVHYMKKALDAAQMGVGNTYPNPAVGCVLVQDEGEDQDQDQEKMIIGSGFHPKAGYPHAEIFALFEACGYVPSGIEAAQTVVRQTSLKSTKRSTKTTAALDDVVNQKDEAAAAASSDTATMSKIDELSKTYASSSDSTNPSSGAETLFQNAFEDKKVTAYVTLEPCCHYGQTPPCARTFVLAGVDRVVVGYRDPNPRVDGGGVTVLRDGGIPVDLMAVSPSELGDDSNDSNSGDDENDGSDSDSDSDVDVDVKGEGWKSAGECADIVKAFAKRITPRTEENGGADVVDYDNSMNGAKRSVLRNLAGRWKKEGTMTEFGWPKYSDSIDKGMAAADNFDLQVAVDSLTIDHGWLEKVDGSLWEEELILLRLNNAIAKKKGVKLLGERVAKELNAHVAQVVGHTVLLYRPGLPPVLDLQKLIEEKVKS